MGQMLSFLPCPNQSASFYDNVRGEYHLLIPVGSTATYLNEEWVYDVVRKKWFLS